MAPYSIVTGLPGWAMGTMSENEKKIFNAIRVGASVYFLKRTPLKKLLEGIV